MSPEQLLELCLRIEDRHGRTRPFPNAPRTLDLDILLYGNLIVDAPNLTIPHPRMAERRFVLTPLAEIAPDAVHPLLGKTIRRLLEICPDRSKVERYEGA